ncbi:unnamed protein product [Paramecium pentaurelia]|uniref:Protein kinase domain-containing protein n=1 Tax=Paramecium pentaurelia TaxID=43138 RepID=A0A8S1VZS5_9CILI|nr:unnamed protein product [Paramecium pentaurelia]
MNKIVIKKKEDMNQKVFQQTNDHAPIQNKNELLCQIDSQWSQRNNNQKKSEKDFQIIEQCLGSGAYGSVSLVRDINSRIYYARKTISKSKLKTQESLDNLKREILIQKKLCHPNILKLCYCYEDQMSVFLILEYAELGSLFQLIKRKQRLQEREAYQYFSQLLAGLEYMHKMKIVHRDLKPENLLITKSGDLKIGDFGWATQMPNYHKAFCGTTEYMSPEMIQSQTTDYKSDLWSLGVLLYEMVQGKTPFQGMTFLEKSQKILSRRQLEYEYDVSEECKSLINSLLQYRIPCRPTIDQIKNHQWMLSQGQDRKGSIRSSSMISVKSTHYTSEVLESQSKILDSHFGQKSSIQEWEAMKFRSLQFQFQRQQDQQQSQGSCCQNNGFLTKALIALGCINR